MGANSSKSTLERRNTITRRSQRRSIHNIRCRVDKVFMEVKRFDGVEEDEKFRKYMLQLDHLRNELLKRQRDLQPQVRRYFQTTLDRLDDAEEALEDQLEDNRDIVKQRQEELLERAKLRQQILEMPENSGAEKTSRESEVASRSGIFRRNKQKQLEEPIEDEEDEEDEDLKTTSQSNRNTRNLSESSDEESDEDAKMKYKRGSREQIIDYEEEPDEEPVPIKAEIKKQRRIFEVDGGNFKNRSQKNKNGRVRQVFSDSYKLQETPTVEAESSVNSASKRKTVELNLVQVISEDRKEPEVQTKKEKKIKSPDEKRKSILKIGIPVMPAAMMNFITKKSKKATDKYDDKSQNNNEDIVQRVNTMINELQTIENQVADFVGKKYGTQYNRIRDKLNRHLVELCQMKTSDEFELEQIKLCRNYVSSCMNFLDDKAIEVKRKQEYEDDVFLPTSRNSSRATSPVARAVSPIQVEEKLHKLSKTTAI